jgi:hydrogenase/urease accessory protein HupE
MFMDLGGQLPVLTQLFMQFSFPLACFVGLIALGSVVALFAVPRPGVWPVIVGAVVLVGLVLVTILAVIACFIPLLSIMGSMSSQP